MSTRRIIVVAFAVLCVSALALAQDPTEPITNWTAPPYWTMPAGGQLREQLTATEVSPENQRVSTESASSTSPILPFTAITPCRLVDTRQSPDTPYLDNGGAGETRTYHFDTTIPYTGTGACSLIPTAAALSLSVQFQVTDHQASLIAYPDDVTRPLVASVMAYNTGLFYMNSAIVPTGADGGIKVFAQWGGQAVININGYYAPSNIVTTLNGLTGAVGVTGGTGITVTTGASTLTIAATGGSGGLLPTGTASQTLRSNGSAWVASSVLMNDGVSNVAISGNLSLPNTTSSTTGVITKGGARFIHDYAGPGTTGRNTFVGQNAGNFSMGSSNFWEASNNTATGYQSLYFTTTGYGNTASGYQSLYANTEGSDNTASGWQSLYSNTTGYDNTASGYQSLYSNTTGSGNTALGYQAGWNLTTGDLNIDIGNQGGAGESNTIRIGDSSIQTRTFIAGISGVTVSGAAVLVNASGQLGVASSSLRFKQDVADMGDASSRVLDLRPVTFRYKAQPDGPRHFGLIAEEVNEVMPELVVRDATGQPETVAYHELPAMLLNELQKQRATIQAQITNQAKTIQAQQAAIGALTERLAALEARLPSR